MTFKNSTRGRFARFAPVAAIFAGLALATPGALAQDYPNRTVTIVVPYGPGGPTDLMGRIIADGLARQLGQPVVIDNRAGAGGNVGAQYVARANPDGYTLLVAASAFTINPSLYADAGYDPIEDFEPISTLGASPNVFLASRESGILTFDDFIAQAQENPGALAYGSPGGGTIPQLAMELLKFRADLDVLHIPYASAGEAVLSAVAGTTELAVSALPAAIGQIEAGMVVPLGVTSADRVEDLPDTPTIEEAGFEDFDLDSVQILIAPATVPAEIVDALARATNAALEDPAVLEAMSTAGFRALPGSPDQLRERIATETPMWAEIIEAAGLAVN